MSGTPANFDRLAKCYRALEVLAFGGDLERARFRFVDELAGCRSILILGEGDGRFLTHLLPRAPNARIHCLDSSAAMLAKATQRIAGSERHRVRFEQADAESYKFQPNVYDAVVTLFFLDCFDAPTAEKVVSRISPSLTPRAQWLYADFATPPRGLARLRARVWLAVLYAFFRWQTGLRTRRLPPAEAIIRSNGFRPKAELTLQNGLLRSVHFVRS